MNLKEKNLHAILQLSPEGIETNSLCDILDVKVSELNNLIGKLDIFYKDSGVKIINDNQSIMLAVDSDCIPKKFNNTNTGKESIGSAAMEVLTIIAYKQPIDALEIEQIRGINSEQSIRYLLEKELIVESKTKHKGIVYTKYNTTKRFLQLAGITNLSKLPKLDL